MMRSSLKKLCTLLPKEEKLARCIVNISYIFVNFLEVSVVSLSPKWWTVSGMLAAGLRDNPGSQDSDLVKSLSIYQQLKKR